MNFPLFKLTARKNLPLMLLFLCLMLFYSVVMIAMFNPDSLEALNAMFEVFPEDMMKAMGFSGAFHNLVGYLASWLYGLVLTAFPLVYCVILGNRLVAKTVDSGSIACLLATPCSRTRLIVTKCIFALLSVVVMQLVVFSVNLLLCRAAFPGEALDAWVFLRLNLTVMLVNLTAMAITFFFSCLFNDSKLSLGFGAGLPIVFLLFNMLGNASEDAKILKSFSLYGWYDPVAIANGGETLAVNLVYVGLVLILSAAGVLIFRKKRLPV